MCAQPCRLPYKLVNQNEKILDTDYLLSTRDLCTLSHLPFLIKCGVSSFKIEGRMKSPTYVATVTRIYRKYIDLAIKYNNGEIPSYEIDKQDKLDLMQVFNRGNFSDGHLLDKPNKNLIFKDKPNNMGIYLGNVINYNKNKGHITLKLKNDVSIGDSISSENESSKYTISELMIKSKNLKTASSDMIVTLGRMKGNIHVNDKIYKITDKSLAVSALSSYSKEFVKTAISCNVTINRCSPIVVKLTATAFNISTTFTSSYIPEQSQNSPITKENVIKQFSKISNTCFEFSNMNVNLDDNLFIPTSALNDVRREAISYMENEIIKSFKRCSNACLDNLILDNNEKDVCHKAILLNILNNSYDYNVLANVDRIYIPLKYFSNRKFKDILLLLSKKANLYIYLPVIIKDSFVDTYKQLILGAFKNFNISGIVVSNLGELKVIEDLNINTNLVANYSFNVFNSYTSKALDSFDTITFSPELEDDYINSINCAPNKEVIVYGKIPLMHINYCLLSSSNRCFKECNRICTNNDKFYLKDRYNFLFRVLPDNLQTITTIYNSRFTDIDYSKLNIDCARFDFLDESIEEINSKINM